MTNTTTAPPRSGRICKPEVIDLEIRGRRNRAQVLLCRDRQLDHGYDVQVRLYRSGLRTWVGTAVIRERHDVAKTLIAGFRAFSA
jgi:hypothetical protein